jgi:hypothetical protein
MLKYLFKIKYIINAIVGHEMMRWKKKDVVLYRATAD